jgi:hypothetical protein
LIAERQPRRPCHQFPLRKQHGRTHLRNQFKVIDGDVLRIAHRKVDTET